MPGNESYAQHCGDGSLDLSEGQGWRTEPNVHPILSLDTPGRHCEQSEAISKSSALHRDCRGTPCLAMTEKQMQRQVSRRASAMTVTLSTAKSLQVEMQKSKSKKDFRGLALRSANSIFAFLFVILTFHL